MVKNTETHLLTTPIKKAFLFNCLPLFVFLFTHLLNVLKQNSGLSTRNLNPLGNTYDHGSRMSLYTQYASDGIPNEIYAGFKLKLKKNQSFSKSLTVSSKHLCLVIGCCGVWWFLMILTCNLFPFEYSKTIPNFLPRCGKTFEPQMIIYLPEEPFKTKNRIILTKQSGRPLKLKVVIRCRKKWNEPNLMYIYHLQCEKMQKIQWNSSNGQFHCFHYVR